MSADSPQQAGGELKQEREALRLSLFEEIETIEGLLESLKGPEFDRVRSDLADKTKRLESINENELTSYKLPLLQKVIAKIKTKVESLAATPLLMTKSRLLEQIDDIQNTLRLIKAADASSQDDERKKLDEQALLLKSKLEDTKKQLESLAGNKLFSAQDSLQTDIAEMKVQATALATRSFLIEEIGVIANILKSAQVSPFKRAELEFLQNEIGDRRSGLESILDWELTSFRRDIVKLKDRAEAVVVRQGFLAWLRSLSVLFWLGLVPALLLVYMSYYAFWQYRNQADIDKTATVFAATHPSATIPPAASETPTVTLTQSVSAIPEVTFTPITPGP
jgi:hypothetical protein